MDDPGMGNTWRAMCPEDYARWRDAALHRAVALRRQAGPLFWRRSWALALRLVRGRREAVVPAPVEAVGSLQRHLEI